MKKSERNWLLLGYVVIMAAFIYYAAYDLNNSLPKQAVERTESPVVARAIAEAAAPPSDASDRSERSEEPEVVIPVPQPTPTPTPLPWPKRTTKPVRPEKQCIDVSWRFKATGAEDPVLHQGEQIFFQLFLDGFPSTYVKSDIVPADSDLSVAEFGVIMRRSEFFNHTQRGVLTRGNGALMQAGFITVNGFSGVDCP